MKQYELELIFFEFQIEIVLLDLVNLCVEHALIVATNNAFVFLLLLTPTSCNLNVRSPLRFGSTTR